MYICNKLLSLARKPLHRPSGTGHELVGVCDFALAPRRESGSTSQPKLASSSTCQTQVLIPAQIRAEHGRRAPRDRTPWALVLNRFPALGTRDAEVLRLPSVNLCRRIHDTEGSTSPASAHENTTSMVGLV